MRDYFKYSLFFEVAFGCPRVNHTCLKEAGARRRRRAVLRQRTAAGSAIAALHQTHGERLQRAELGGERVPPIGRGQRQRQLVRWQPLGDALQTVSTGRGR